VGGVTEEDVKELRAFVEEFRPEVLVFLKKTSQVPK
jgi:hypothetical protein